LAVLLGQNVGHIKGQSIISQKVTRPYNNLTN
jgi:hypothetical protein